VTYGDPVTLSGAVDPPSGGEVVRLVDDAGTELGEATTGAAGRFSFEFVPEANLVVTARWEGAESAPVALEVRPDLRVSLGPVRLFDRAIARGTMAPTGADGTIRVRLLRSGRAVGARSVAVDGSGRFRTSFRILRPGRYRAVARFGGPDHLPARARSEVRATPLPELRVGSRGPAVRALERRLVELRYHLPGVDDRYGAPTADAVMAFRKVQGLPRRWTVGPAVWRALADPRPPRARAGGRGFHVEVDQTRQVLYTVRDGRVIDVLHVSTGAGGATRDGTFRVYRKLAGYSPNRLYYPSYFDGLRAIHGWPEVPSYPASHGCVRVPMWSATWIYGRVRLGTRVVVYHS
jgi:hypothetical protein